MLAGHLRILSRAHLVNPLPASNLPFSLPFNRFSLVNSPRERVGAVNQIMQALAANRISTRRAAILLEGVQLAPVRSCRRPRARF